MQCRLPSMRGDRIRLRVFRRRIFSPASVSHIDARAFRRCSSLDAENVTVDAGEGKTVTVPRAWIDEHPALVEAVGGDVAATLQSLAGNGKMSVAGCYVLGLDPEVSTNGFKIVAFPMKADGTPDLEGLAFEPRCEEWNVQEARPVVKGVKNIGDDD